MHQKINKHKQSFFYVFIELIIVSFNFVQFKKIEYENNFPKIQAILQYFSIVNPSCFITKTCKLLRESFIGFQKVQLFM